MGGLGALATAGGLGGVVWPMLAREDLIPGVPPRIRLPRGAWTTTDDHLTFAVLGDNGSGGRQAMAVATQMARTYREAPFGLVSLLGDVCYYGSIEDRFVDVFVKPLGPLIDAGVAFELAIGNHDGAIFLAEPRLREIEARLELLGTPGRFYMKTHGPADFFYLDTSVSALYGPLADEQLRWIDTALAAADRRWRIVCTHHPPYSSGRHGVTPGVVERLVPIFERHRVDLVLSGHDHHYERTSPINGVTYVVSGGGCKTSPVFGAHFTVVARSVLQFLHVEMEGDRLVARSIAPNGAIIDQFDLSAQR